MPSFSYKGRDASGAAVRGVVDGASPGAAADALALRGITPLDIHRAETLATRWKIEWPTWRDERVLPLDVMMFSRQIHALLKAGVPIMRALGGLQESAVNPAMAKLLRTVREQLDAGRELSASFAQFPAVFTPFYLAMVRVGEMTGTLERIFLRLFAHLEFEKFMREQVRSALRYPSFVVTAMTVALVVINIWVIPAFARVYRGLNAELPLMTRVLIGFSDFMVASWPYLLGAALAAGFALRGWAATAGGRRTWDRIKFDLPISGRIVLKATLARFARSFALALKSGVPAVQAMRVVADTVDNVFLSEKITGMREGVERGESVLTTAAAAGVFTPVVLQMIAVGEETGALDDLLEEIGEMYQQEVEYELKTLSAQIEPILIVFLGVLVLVLALGIFLPIWDLGRTMMHKGP
ncbi:MAG: type II secretion system F family protein [Betaproteobacteria bacterium]|nr:type II secretion system F family protein [Betaproteobacteria bacterium]